MTIRINTTGNIQPMANYMAGHQDLVFEVCWRSRSCLLTHITTERPPIKSAKTKHHIIKAKRRREMSANCGKNSPNWATQSHKSPHLAVHNDNSFSDSCCDAQVHVHTSSTSELLSLFVEEIGEEDGCL